MAAIDDVLERLVAEPEFRAQLRRDPAAALSGYLLYDEDLEVLATSLDESDGGDHTVEQRTNRSAFLASALAGLEGWGGAGITSSDLAAPPDAEDGTAAKKDGTISIRGKDISVTGSGE